MKLLLVIISVSLFSFHGKSQKLKSDVRDSLWKAFVAEFKKMKMRKGRVHTDSSNYYYFFNKGTHHPVYAYVNKGEYPLAFQVHYYFKDSTLTFLRVLIHNAITKERGFVLYRFENGAVVSEEHNGQVIGDFSYLRNGAKKAYQLGEDWMRRRLNRKKRGT